MSQFSVAVKCWVELQEPASKCLKMSTLDMEDFPWLVVAMLSYINLGYIHSKNSILSLQVGLSYCFTWFNVRSSLSIGLEKTILPSIITTTIVPFSSPSMNQCHYPSIKLQTNGKRCVPKFTVFLPLQAKGVPLFQVGKCNIHGFPSSSSSILILGKSSILSDCHFCGILVARNKLETSNMI